MIDKTVNTISNLSVPAKVFSLLLSFIAPLASLIHVIVLLLFVDAITSIYYQMKIAGSKAERGKRISTAIKVIESGKLRKTIEKMFFYVLTIIVFYSFDLYVLQIKPISENSIYTFSITNLSAVLISLVELTSIASNVSKITDNPIFNRVVSLFSKKVEKKFDIEE